MIKTRGNWFFPLILALLMGSVSVWLDRVSQVSTEEIALNPSEPKYVHTKWGVGYYFQA